jgi:spore coat protein U-like protein
MSGLPKARLALAGALMILSVAAAAAQTCTATMTNMDFGNVEVALDQNVDTIGTLTVNCSGTGNTQLRLCLHLCEGSGGMDTSDMTPRYMNNSSGLQYNLFKDGAFAQVWGRVKPPVTRIVPAPPGAAGIWPWQQAPS